MQIFQMFFCKESITILSVFCKASIKWSHLNKIFKEKREVGTSSLLLAILLLFVER